MPSRLNNWIDRFLGRAAALPSIDLLASTPSPRDTLENRLNWLVDLVQWIRRPGREEDTALPRTQIQAGRLRRFLDVLDKNPDWKLKVAQTLRSIIRETNALDLFAETGLPRQFGLLQEASGRIAKTVLPSVPGSPDLGVLFDRLFPHQRDEAWIERLDEATLKRFQALLEFEVAEEDAKWNSLADDLEDALVQLAALLRVSGCSHAIRSRIKNLRIRELPFFKLSQVVRAVLAARERQDATALLSELNYLRLLMDGCYRVTEEVHAHLEENGVDSEIVYQLASIDASLKRLEALLDIAFSPERPLVRIGAFVAMLVRENQARRSVLDLLQQSFGLLTRKIVERNAETGEHYITRTAKEYWQMVRQAAGGGGITAFTVWFKTVLFSWHLAPLLQGLGAGLNYAVSFVAIQLCGFTLATKQPASTAPALADRMHRVREPRALEELVDEVVCLIRSQVAGILGNICMVAPVAVALHYLLLRIWGHPMMSVEKAEYTLHSVSLLGPSFFYAALTGVLLWASSLVAAWADNWFICHHIGEALAVDRRLIRVLGTTRTARIARFFTKNISGLGGNISLGFMLGLFPALAEAFNLPLDIRHITLSSGSVAVAVATLGSSALATTAFWLAAAGTLLIGAINVGVSFSLAMLVAIRARAILAPERHIIYQALFRRLRQKPLSFVLPVGVAAESASHGP